MKLGIFYTVFDGIELLKPSVENIINHVDLVCIVYQNTSNYGQYEDVGKQINELGFNSEKIHILNFEPSKHLPVKEKEKEKHDFAIQYLKAQGCSHFIMSATDHFYKVDEFIDARKKAVFFDVTLTNMFTYYKYPTWQLTPIESYQMPFICRMYPTTEISSQEYTGLKTDPSVRINTRMEIYCFKENEIMLHHYSMLRKDIVKKLSNAALFNRSQEQINGYINEHENYSLQGNKGVSYFHGRKIKEVDNYFGLNLSE